MDIVDKQTRSKMMSGIKSKNTRPELVIRKALHKIGFRYRVHSPSLPGKPDIVFAKYKAVILINGCFWHLHECELFKWPKTRASFWREKLNRNKSRDKRNLQLIQDLGYRVLVVWECSIKSKKQSEIDFLISRIKHWLISGNQCLTL